MFHGVIESFQSDRWITTMSWSRKIVPDNNAETRLDLFQDVSIFVNFGEGDEGDNPDAFNPAVNLYSERINLYQPSSTSAAQSVFTISFLHTPAVFASLALFSLLQGSII